MIYVVKKFRHDLLANKFIFFVDHQALLCLVNKPCATGLIVRWFVILLEFDFEVAVKKGRMHQRADHLSRITSGKAPTTGVDDDIPDATLFRIETVPRWSAKIIEVLTTRWVSQPSLTIESTAELETCALYKLFSGRLYWLGPEGVLRLCPNPDQYEELLDYMHVNIRRISCLVQRDGA